MTEPTAIEIGTLVLQLGAVAAVYAKLQSAMRQMAGKGEGREITNDPLNVRAAEEFVSRRECGIMHRGLEGRVARLETRFAEHIHEAKATTDKLRDDLSDIRDRMTDQFAVQHDTLRAIERAVGRLEG